MPCWSRSAVAMPSLVLLAALSATGGLGVQAIERSNLMRHELASSLNLEDNAPKAKAHTAEHGNGDEDREEKAKPASAQEESDNEDSDDKEEDKVKALEGKAISTDDDGQPDTEEENEAIYGPPHGSHPDSEKSGSGSAAEKDGQEEEQDEHSPDHDEYEDHDSLAAQRAVEEQAAQEYLEFDQHLRSHDEGDGDSNSNSDGDGDSDAAGSLSQEAEEHKEDEDDEELEEEDDHSREQLEEEEDPHVAQWTLHPDDMEDDEEETMEVSLSDTDVRGNGTVETWPVPTATPTDNEKSTCDKVPDTAVGVNPYWKGTNIIATDKKQLDGSFTDQATCLKKALKACFIATAFKWDSKNKKCYCLYGNVAPEGGSGHHMFVCKLKKSYMAAHCTSSIWITGQAKAVTRTEYATHSHSANACAIKAKGDGCDAAEMPRGNSGKCTCVKKKKKDTKLAFDTSVKTTGVCPIEAIATTTPADR